MKPEIFTWLEDIDRSIVEIFDFLPEKRDFYLFQNDLKTRKAIERNLEIIGEALNRILKQTLIYTLRIQEKLWIPEIELFMDIIP